jgi:hypothetical protein
MVDLRIGLAAGCCIALATAPSFAEPTPDNSVQADLGSGVLGVGYERTLAPALSARATFQLNRPWYTQILGGPETDVIGFGLELRPFIFPMGSAPAGLYVSPFGRLVAIRAQDDLPEAKSAVGWSAGATAGYGWLLADDALLLRFGAGVQYWAFEIDDGGKSAGFSGAYPDVDIIVGYAF